MKSARIALLALCAVLAAAPAGAGWPPALQKEIVEDAIYVTPAEVKAYLEKHKAEVLRGAEIPLLTIRDFPDQAFYPTAPTAGAVKKAVEHVAAAAAALRAKEDARAARQLGMASTYLAGIVQPRRFAGRETGYWEFHRQLIPSTLKMAPFSRPVKVQDLLVPAGQTAARMGDDHQSDTERYEMALKLVRDAWLVAWLDGGREIEEDLKVEHSYKRVGEARGFTLDETPKGKPTVQAVRRWVIPFDKEIGGKAIFVKVKLNNKLDVTYHLDTGASLVTISRATARELGIQVTRETKRISVMTANGVLEVPLVELESVGIADAVALKVRAIVCDSCGQGAIIEGLLGLSYLNNFNYKVDSDRGHLILETK